MRLGFVTCVELGLAAMEGVYQAGGRLHVALTLEDDRAANKSGRVHIDAFCDGLGIPLRKIRSINDPETLGTLREADLDWLFVIGWSEIARKEVLETPRLGVLGMHPTLLPEGRGRAPIPWAIIKGVKTTGVTLFKLDEGVDSGPVLDQLAIEIGTRENAGTLYEKVRRAHRVLAASATRDLLSGCARFVAQDHSLATYWPARKPSDGELHGSLSVEEADRLVRAVTRPYPGARASALDGRRLLVWAAEIAETSPRGTDVPVLRFADGLLIVTEYEIATE